MRHTRLAAVLGVLLALPGLAFDLTTPSTWFGGNTVTAMGRQHDTSHEVTSNGVTKVQMQYLYKEDWLVTDVDMSKAHGGITNLVAGQNIVIEEPTPGTKKISAIGGGGGGVSPEDVNFLVGLYDSTNLTPRINAKQNQLTAGSNITITVVGDQTVISATGGGGGGSDIDWHGVTNVAVTVVTEKVPSWARDPDAAITNGFAKLADLPQKISDLTNDAEYVTKAVTNGLASAADLPKKLSDLTNDTEYVTKTVTNGLVTAASVTAVSNALDAAKADKAGDLEGYGITNAYTKTEVDSEITGNVVDNTTSTNGTKALSANQGRLLKDEIDRLKGRGKYLSIWNARTGLAMTSPGSVPYTYQSGDYFIVGILSPTNTIPNYKPFGTTYTTNAPSTVVETNLVAVNDTYIFDGTSWSLMHSDQPTVTFGSIAGSPEDNDALKTAFDGKRGLTDLDVYEGEDKTGNKLATTNQLHTAVNTATNALKTEVDNTLTNYYKKVDNIAITTNGVVITSATSVSQLGDLPFLKRGATVYMPPDEDDPGSTATWTTYTMGEIDYTGKSIKVPQKSGTMLLDVDIAADLTVTNRGQVADASDVRAGLALRRALDDMDVYSGTEPTGDRLATTTGVSEIVSPMIGAATNDLRRVDDMAVYEIIRTENTDWTLTTSDGVKVRDGIEIARREDGRYYIYFNGMLRGISRGEYAVDALSFAYDGDHEYIGSGGTAERPRYMDETLGPNNDLLATTNGVNAAVAEATAYSVKSNGLGEAQVDSLRFSGTSGVKAVYGADSEIVFKQSGSSWSAFGGKEPNGYNRELAIGPNATASRTSATAIGYNAQATSYDTVAVGDNAVASKENTTALGIGATASDRSATAIGCGAMATGTYTAALGLGATASGPYATALGYGASAERQFATAVGAEASASRDFAVALGYKSVASNDYAVTIGSWYDIDGAHVWYGDHGTNTLNFAVTDNPNRVYFRHRTLADIIHDEAPAPGDYANVSNAAMNARSLTDNICHTNSYGVNWTAYGVPAGTTISKQPSVMMNTEWWWSGAVQGNSNDVDPTVSDVIPVTFTAPVDWGSSVFTFRRRDNPAIAFTAYCDAVASDGAPFVTANIAALRYDTYSKEETDYRIVELAPAPGDYANVSNKAVTGYVAATNAQDRSQKLSTTLGSYILYFENWATNNYLAARLANYRALRLETWQEGLTNGTASLPAIDAVADAKADKTSVYTKNETEQKILELAPAPGEYATVSNRAMNAIQYGEVEPPGDYLNVSNRAINAIQYGEVEPPGNYEAVSNAAMHAVVYELAKDGSQTAVTVGTRPTLSTAKEWSAEKTYLQCDVVQHDGVVYICTASPSATVGPSEWGAQAGNWTEIASGVYSVTAGSTNVAAGASAHAEGHNTYADGDTSHAEGVYSRSAGVASHAEGTSTLASGEFSHAEGSQTEASGLASHAEGSNTSALGLSSHAEGYRTYADGLAAHATGCGSFAEGIAARASGIWTYAGGIDARPSDPSQSVYRPASWAAGWAAAAESAGAFAWQGLPVGRDPLVEPDPGETYTDNGPGTFNVNPVGGLDGFWVGRTNMATHVKAVARKLIKDAVGSLGEGATAADIINALKAIGD